MDIETVLAFRPELTGGSFTLSPPSLAGIVRAHFERTHGPIQGPARAAAYLDALRRHSAAGAVPPPLPARPAAATAEGPVARDATPLEDPVGFHGVMADEEWLGVEPDEEMLDGPATARDEPLFVRDALGDHETAPPTGRGRPAAVDRTPARALVHALVRSAATRSMTGRADQRTIDALRRAWAADPAIVRIHPVLALPDSMGGIADHVESPTSLRSILRGLVADGLLASAPDHAGAPTWRLADGREDVGRRAAAGSEEAPAAAAPTPPAPDAPEPQRGSPVMALMAGILGLAATGAMIAGAIIAEREDGDD